MRRDIVSAYAASASRVLSWVIVSALVYRRSHEAFAMMALIRGTIGILNYAALGLLPAMIRALAAIPQLVPVPVVSISESEDAIPLPYVTPQTTRDQARGLRANPDETVQRIYGAGTAIATVTAIVSLLLCGIAAGFANHLFRIPEGDMSESVSILILSMGAGIVTRWYSEPSAAILQVRRDIFLDNCLQVTAELGWVLLGVTFIYRGLFYGELLRCVGVSYFLSSVLLLVSRMTAAKRTAHVIFTANTTWKILLPLLATGALITLAQLADYLYSPTDYLLINHLLTSIDLTHYAPAVQIDSGLLLLVTGLGSVLLPKAALAHAAGNREVVRAYYLRGTIASAATLIAASAVIYFASPLIFRLWFGQPMPGTVAILPLVLLNTIIGGSSAVGRAILIGIGKAKPFTIAVLLAGVTNVICSYVFVRYCHWGLHGIILGTIVAVMFRCGIWMPWYVLKELRIGNGLRVTGGPPVSF